MFFWCSGTQTSGFLFWNFTASQPETGVEFDSDGTPVGAESAFIPSRVPASQRLASTVLFTQNLKFENPKLEGDELALKVAEQVRRATRNGIKVIT